MISSGDKGQKADKEQVLLNLQTVIFDILETRPESCETMTVI